MLVFSVVFGPLLQAAGALGLSHNAAAANIAGGFQAFCPVVFWREGVACVFSLFASATVLGLIGACPTSQARSYTQAGSRARGFLRWLRRGGMLLQPDYIDILVRKGRNDPTPRMEKIAVVDPMQLAMILRTRAQHLLFPDAAVQREFFEGLDPWFLRVCRACPGVCGLLIRGSSRLCQR